MKNLAILLAALGFALPVLAASDPQATADPLAEARQGKLQCYVQDAARKTCRALAGYQFRPDGTIQNPALVLVSLEPVTIMAVASQVTVKADAVCGVSRAEDIDKASLAVAGQQLSQDQARIIKTQIKTMLAGRIGKEVCTTYAPAGDHLAAQVTVDGAPAPELSAEVVWVGPNDGYTVAP
jgi:hypothetical protein